MGVRMVRPEVGKALKMHNDKDYKLSTPNSRRQANVRPGPVEIFSKSALHDSPSGHGSAVHVDHPLGTCNGQSFTAK